MADPPEFLTGEPVLRLFGPGDDKDLRERYILHVMTKTPLEEMREEAFRSRQRVIGSRDFKKRMKAADRLQSVERDQPPPAAATELTVGFV